MLETETANSKASYRNSDSDVDHDVNVLSALKVVNSLVPQFIVFNRGNNLNGEVESSGAFVLVACVLFDCAEI